MENDSRHGFRRLWSSHVRFPSLFALTSPFLIFLTTTTSTSTSSAADDISGETVAIKLVTRVFEKVSLAKRALREITLLRHFASHENITGLIDVDAISKDFNEM